DQSAPRGAAAVVASCVHVLNSSRCRWGGSLSPRTPRRRGYSRRRARNLWSVPVAALKAMGADLEGALDHGNVPRYAIDRQGVVRWMTPAARGLVGDQVGRQFTSVVAPEDTRRAREQFTRKLLGNTEVTDGSFAVVDLSGAHLAVEVSSVPLRRGEHVVG